MSLNVNSGSVNIVGSNTLAQAFPVPSASQVIKSGGVSANSAGEALHTVTATKTFYLTALTLQNNGGANRFMLRDGGAGGTIMYYGGMDTATVHIAFPTPIAFSTDVYLALTGAADHRVGFSGFEQ